MTTWRLAEGELDLPNPEADRMYVSPVPAALVALPGMSRSMCSYGILEVWKMSRMEITVSGAVTALAGPVNGRVGYQALQMNIQRQYLISCSVRCRKKDSGFVISIHMRSRDRCLLVTACHRGMSDLL